VAPEKKAAIDEQLAEQTLGEISAADFLKALNRGGLVSDLVVWPEKKKVELYIEPENLEKVNFGRLIEIIRGEKKKRELEPYPFVRVSDPSPQPNISATEELARTLDARLRAIEQRLGL
jgi:hypothetical protein